MTCPHLEYREAGEDVAFDTPRAYCTVADRFVQPMRADVCNDRYDLDHAEHCEIFREHEASARAGDSGNGAGRTDDSENGAGRTDDSENGAGRTDDSVSGADGGEAAGDEPEGGA